jgi:hypothetical protein
VAVRVAGVLVRSLAALIQRIRQHFSRGQRSNALVRPPGELPWLDGYTGQTTNELIRLTEQYRIDSVVLAFEQALDQKAERVGLENLSATERVVLTVEGIEREVNSDGFDGLFRNSYNRYAPHFVEALRAIGRADVATLTQEALGALNLQGPPTVETIEVAINADDEARDEKLDDLARRYYEVAGDLAPDLLDFIRANQAEIVLSANAATPGMPDAGDIGAR